MPDNALSPPEPLPQLSLSVSGTADLLQRIWHRNQPLIHDRVATLEQFAAAVLVSEHTQAARHHALDLAHKLAGSLGMFGYMEGTQAARALEQHLEGDNALVPEQVAALVAQLQAALPS